MPTPVLVLHGLGRSARSMRPLERALQRAGFAPTNVDYPSRCRSVAAHVEAVVAPQVAALRDGQRPVHFVTHSLGGVLVRAYAAAHPLPPGSRAVMLAPPHGGSEVADLLGGRWPFDAACGPALAELGTGAGSVPRALGALRGVEAGVIAGRLNVYPFGRAFGTPHDGLVSVESARAEGLADFVVVRRGHGLIMRAPEVIRQTLAFLETGRFEKPRRARPDGAADGAAAGA